MTTLETPIPQSLGALAQASRKLSPFQQDNFGARALDTLKNQPRATTGEWKFINALRHGNEAAFGTLIDQYHSKLLRMARMFVNSHALAEEVVQETWLAVWEGISNFEGRSSLKTWLFQILSNRARTKGVRENRYVPMGNRGPAPSENDYGVESEWIHSVNHKKDQGDIAPRFREERTPYRLLLSKEINTKIEKTIQSLPSKQRQVISLRDIEGFDSETACGLLNITETNQRVLLHRARIKVRAELTRCL